MIITLTYDEYIETLIDVQNWYLSAQETQLIADFENDTTQLYNLNKVIKIVIHHNDMQS